jgi:hypothetical protein
MAVACDPGLRARHSVACTGPTPLLPFANSDALRINMCAMAAFRSCTCANTAKSSASGVRRCQFCGLPVFRYVCLHVGDVGRLQERQVPCHCAQPLNHNAGLHARMKDEPVHRPMDRGTPAPRLSNCRLLGIERPVSRGSKTMERTTCALSCNTGRAQNKPALPWTHVQPQPR